MQIGIYMIGTPPGHSEMAALAARVAKHVMPGIQVFHFTDTETIAINGCEVVRRERTVPMAVFRMQHHQTPGEWLFIDSDVLVTKDVSGVFKHDFDVALAARIDGDGSEDKSYSEMPHNMGVVFSRSPEFWSAVEKELKTYGPKLQEWMGDQLAVCRLMKNYNVRVLPVAYNYPPFFEGDTAPVLHFKGKQRKKWMLGIAEKIFNPAFA